MMPRELGYTLIQIGLAILFIVAMMIVVARLQGMKEDLEATQLADRRFSIELGWIGAGIIKAGLRQDLTAVERFEYRLSLLKPEIPRGTEPQKIQGKVPMPPPAATGFARGGATVRPSGPARSSRA